MRRLAGLVVVLIATAACGEAAEVPRISEAARVVETTTTTTTTPTTTPSTAAVTSSTTTTTTIPEPPPILSARADQPLPIYGSATAADPARTLEATTILGTPTVVHVLDDSGDRLEVLVPGRPNGAVGWVERSDVEIFPLDTRVFVELDARRLIVERLGVVIFQTDVGIGTPASPTPTGEYFITDAVRLTDTGGPWGPYAYGLSARSDTVTEFNGGDGIIGIHGTNRPGSVGGAQSLGCIRLANDAILELSELLTVGVPVTITR